MKRFTILAILTLITEIACVIPSPPSSATTPFHPDMSGIDFSPYEQIGSLDVTKEVDWGTLPVDDDQTFEICINGPSYPNGNCQIVDYAGGTLTWQNLLPGDYSIEETDPGDMWDVLITTESLTASITLPVTSTVTVYPQYTRTVTVKNRICQKGDPGCKHDNDNDDELSEYEVIITPEAGGTLTIDHFTITFPPGSVPEPVKLVFIVPTSPPDGVDPGQHVIYHFILKAYALSDNSAVTQFLEEYVITLSYVLEELLELLVDETTLSLAFFDNGQWVFMDSTVDNDNAIVITRSDHFTEFALIGNVAATPPQPTDDTDSDPDATPDPDPVTPPQPTDDTDSDPDATLDPDPATPQPTDDTDPDPDVGTPDSVPPQSADDISEPSEQPNDKPDTSQQTHQVYLPIVGR